MSEDSNIDNENSKVNFSGAHIEHLTIAMNDLVSNGANIKDSSKVDRPSVSHFDVQLQKDFNKPYLNGTKRITTEINIKRSYDNPANNKKRKTKSCIIYLYLLIFAEAWNNVDTPEITATQTTEVPSAIVETASQILTYHKSSDKFIFYKEALEEIIEENQVGHLPVVFISVVGPFRTGKSFLLNLMSRYFAAEDKDLWLGGEDEPVDLKEFAFKSGPKRETTGMLVSRRVHVAKDENGEDVAVLLADTQGLFDSLTTQKEASVIFSLSTMISSMLLYNLQGKLDSSNLESLTAFLEYAKYTSQSFQEKPFDNIHVLVRDWPWPDDYVYGRHGGKRYIESWLNAEDSPAHLKKITDSVKFSFKNVYCYLLPEPDAKLKRSGSGAKLTVNEMGAEFIRHVRDMIKSMWKNLTVKRINREKVTVLELVDLIDEHVKLYNETGVPDPSLQVDVWAKLYYKRIVKKLSGNCESAVENVINTIDSVESLSSVFEVCKSEIFNEFNSHPTYSESEKKISEEKINKILNLQYQSMTEDLEKDLKYVNSEIKLVDKKLEDVFEEYKRNVQSKIDSGEINTEASFNSAHSRLKHHAEYSFSSYFTDMQNRAWNPTFNKLEGFRSNEEKTNKISYLQNLIERERPNFLKIISERAPKVEEKKRKWYKRPGKELRRWKR